MRIGRISSGYRLPPVVRKGRVGLKYRKTPSYVNKDIRRAKKLQGEASFNKSLEESMRASFNKGGYASIQEMETHCGNKITKNSMK